jgi:hypothetical protein
MDKQKITLEVEDISTLLDGLNNAMIAYDDIIWAIYLCCKIPSKLEPLKSLPFEQLRERLKALKDVYEQLIKIEKGEQS